MQHADTVTKAPFVKITAHQTLSSSTMAEQLSREERLSLIHLNLAEVLKPDIIEHVVLKEDRPLRIYWGMAKFDARIYCNC